MHIDNTGLYPYSPAHTHICASEGALTTGEGMSRIAKEDDGINPVDVYIGNKVKARRRLLGLSQEELAKSIGLTFQQVQKYEKGTNRISVSRLVDICRSLKTPFDYFLDGSGPLASAKVQPIRGFSDTKQEMIESSPDIMTRRDVLELVRAYARIKSPKLQKQILEMAKAISNPSGNEGK